jgi:hypothetical protein
MNEPAFPVPMIPLDREGGHTEVRCLGMTLRDYFAAAAMQGMMTGVCGSLNGEFAAYARGPCNAEVAERAYVLADRMLAERAKAT